MNVDLQGARCEEESARLLPWYVTGRLEPADVERVANHLEHCAICRTDVAHERALRGFLKSDNCIEFAPQPGLAKTLLRIDELSHEDRGAASPLPFPRSAPRRRVRAIQWLTAAVVVQTVALGWLGLSTHRDSVAFNSPYRTLSADAPPTANGAHLRVVFAPTTMVGDLDSMLASHGLTIVRGPSAAGVYTLAALDPNLEAARLARSLEALRADARIRFIDYAINDEAKPR